MKEIMVGEGMMYCLVNVTYRKACDGALEGLSRK